MYDMTYDNTLIILVIPLYMLVAHLVFTDSGQQSLKTCVIYCMYPVVALLALMVLVFAGGVVYGYATLRWAAFHLNVEGDPNPTIAWIVVNGIFAFIDVCVPAEILFFAQGYCSFFKQKFSHLRLMRECDIR